MKTFYHTDRILFTGRAGEVRAALRRLTDRCGPVSLAEFLAFSRPRHAPRLDGPPRGAQNALPIARRGRRGLR